MKKFTEPVIEIFHLNITDIITASSELIGWAGLDDVDSFLDDIDLPD